jgi:hypothetical protein
MTSLYTPRGAARICAVLARLANRRHLPVRFKDDVHVCPN